MRFSLWDNSGRWVWLSILALPVLGCYEITATFEPTTSAKATSRGSQCEYEIFTIPPQSKFQELGVVHFRDSVEQDVDNTQFLLAAATGSTDEYKKNRKPESEIKPHAEALTVTQIRDVATRVICMNGGNGLIVSQPNAEGKYIQGTVILLEKI